MKRPVSKEVLGRRVLKLAALLYLKKLRRRSIAADVALRFVDFDFKWRRVSELFGVVSGIIAAPGEYQSLQGAIRPKPTLNQPEKSPSKANGPPPGVRSSF
jgi:uncharacterized protein with WD repeat